MTRTEDLTAIFALAKTYRSCLVKHCSAVSICLLAVHYVCVCTADSLISSVHLPMQKGPKKGKDTALKVSLYMANLFEDKDAK